MARWHRPAIIVLALLALGASIDALYVEYQLASNPNYSAFCDINSAVSCVQVLESAYARVGGIPVAAGGAIWAGLVLLLSIFGMRRDANETAPAGSAADSTATDGASRAAAYIFMLATVGLAAVFYYAYTSFFVLKVACPLCLTIDVAVVGVFLVSASAAGALSALPSHLGADLGALRRSPGAATGAALWLVASLALVMFFPSAQAATASTEVAEAAAPVEQLSTEQLDEWDKWLDAQPRAQEVLPDGNVKVLVVKFNDWQCPACRALWLEYRGIIAKYEGRYPGVFKFEYRDFPLESECGFGGVHGSACEAAVAVRLARGKGKGDTLGEYFYEHQEELSRDEVKKALRDIAGVDDFDQQYAKVIPVVHADAVLGQKLGVNGTPTFFINGIKVPSLRPAYFDAAIAYALKKAGVTS